MERSPAPFIKFPSIGPFNEILTSLKKLSGGNITNANGLKFVGTVKIHGTNAAVGYSNKCGLWSQSRSRVLDVRKKDADNLDFAKFVNANQDHFISLLTKLANSLNVDLENQGLVIFGEWCGKRIQNKVSVCNLPHRMFVVFDAFSFEYKTGNVTDTKEVGEWQDISLLREHFRKPFNMFDTNNISLEQSFLCFNIFDFETYSIDFNSADLRGMKKELERITLEVEKECPVGRGCGVSKKENENVVTTGEGVVWRSVFKNPKTNKLIILRFKVKGDEHAVSKSQRGAEIDVVKSDNFNDFIENVVSEERCQQALFEIFGQATKEPPFMKEQTQQWLSNVGKFQQWIVHDVKKEEMSSFPFLDDFNGTLLCNL